MVRFPHVQLAQSSDHLLPYSPTTAPKAAIHGVYFIFLKSYVHPESSTGKHAGSLCLVERSWPSPQASRERCYPTEDEDGLPTEEVGLSRAGSLPTQRHHAHRSPQHPAKQVSLWFFPDLGCDIPASPFRGLPSLLWLQHPAPNLFLYPAICSRLPSPSPNRSQRGGSVDLTQP